MIEAGDIHHNLDPFLEERFVFDYAAFGLRMNVEAATALYSQACNTSNPVLVKSLCLSCMQSMFSTWEDFALLLRAFLEKKASGLPIYRYLSGENQNRGSTEIPQIFKKQMNQRELFDVLGFADVGYRYIVRYYLDITKAKFEEDVREFNRSVKLIGSEQQRFNDIKNVLKHGKGFFEGATLSALALEEKADDRVAFYTWVNLPEGKKLRLEWQKVPLQQAEICVVHCSKIYIRSMYLLWLFMLQYHRDAAYRFHQMSNSLYDSVVGSARRLNIKSKGLTI